MSMLDSSQLVTCPDCGCGFDDSERFCPNCGKPRSAIEQALRRYVRLTGEDYELARAYAKEHSLRPLTVDQRRVQLDAAIRVLTIERFQLVTQTDTTATFNAPRGSNGLLITFIIGLAIVTFGIALLLLLILRNSRDEPVFIEVDPFGEITVTGRAGHDVRKRVQVLNEA